jgi:hypothetical protein
VSVNLNLTTWEFPQATRFILVNDRMPLNEEHCRIAIDQADFKISDVAFLDGAAAYFRRRDIQFHQ